MTKKKSKKAPSRRRPARPIQLYFWPTPNGLKISIMLEECGLPYTVHPVNIGKGEQFGESFLKISPNHRIPAIIDPDGPGGKPIAIFESGAILQYLGRKTGKHYPKDERTRVKVDEWLFWQVGGLGPMSGQAGHFRNYAVDQIPYAIDRYTNEVHRLYGVMNKQLARRPFLADKFSIADIACWGWVNAWKRHGQHIGDFPHLKAWLERVGERPGVARGSQVGAELRKPDYDLRKDKNAHKILFGQRARA